jgi:hypothetical protein
VSSSSWHLSTGKTTHRQTAAAALERIEAGRVGRSTLLSLPLYVQIAGRSVVFEFPWMPARMEAARGIKPG